MFTKQKIQLVKDGSDTYTAETLSSSADTFRFLQRMELHLESTEKVIVCALNIKNKVMSYSEVAHGGVSSCSLSPCDIFRFVIMTGCTKFLIAHNHPSGDATPSPEDVAMTRRISEGAKLLGLDMVDHIIVADNNYRSITAC